MEGRDGMDGCNIAGGSLLILYPTYLPIYISCLYHVYTHCSGIPLLVTMLMTMASSLKVSSPPVSDDMCEPGAIHFSRVLYPGGINTPGV